MLFLSRSYSTQPSHPKPCGILSASGRVPGLRLWEPAEHGDCDSFGLELREALHRNLGGFGPDDGEESIVYRLTGRDRASCTKREGRSGNRVGV